MMTAFPSSGLTRPPALSLLPAANAGHVQGRVDHRRRTARPLSAVGASNATVGVAFVGLLSTVVVVAALVGGAAGQAIVFPSDEADDAGVASGATTATTAAAAATAQQPQQQQTPGTFSPITGGWGGLNDQQQQQQRQQQPLHGADAVTVASTTPIPVDVVTVSHNSSDADAHVNAVESLLSLDAAEPGRPLAAAPTNSTTNGGGENAGSSENSDDDKVDISPSAIGSRTILPRGYGASCPSPTGDAGSCGTVRDCPGIYRIRDPGYLRRFLCGYYQRTPLVCCPRQWSNRASFAVAPGGGNDYYRPSGGGAARPSHANGYGYGENQRFGYGGGGGGGGYPQQAPAGPSYTVYTDGYGSTYIVEEQPQSQQQAQYQRAPQQPYYGYGDQYPRYGANGYGQRPFGVQGNAGGPFAAGGGGGFRQPQPPQYPPSAPPPPAPAAIPSPYDQYAQQQYPRPVTPLNFRGSTAKPTRKPAGASSASHASSRPQHQQQQHHHTHKQQGGGGREGAGGEPASASLREARPQRPAALPAACGTGHGISRIVGGSEAIPGSYPWMAAIYIQSGKSWLQACGGALISHAHVVTAAHCVVAGSRSQNLPARLFLVRLGDHNLVTTDELPEGATRDVHVAKISRHSDFDPKTYQNDVALMLLADQVEFTRYIQPICLPYDAVYGDLVNEIAIVTGWGYTKYGGQGSNVLKQATIRVWSQDECKSAFKREVIINENYLCAGDGDGKKDSCQGDSGGPLVYNEGTRFYLIGIVSFGKKCATPGYPGAYTRVTKYLDWINNHL